MLPEILESLGSLHVRISALERIQIKGGWGQSVKRDLDLLLAGTLIFLLLLLLLLRLLLLLGLLLLLLLGLLLLLLLLGLLLLACTSTSTSVLITIKKRRGKVSK